VHDAGIDASTATSTSTTTTTKPKADAGNDTSPVISIPRTTFRTITGITTGLPPVTSITTTAPSAH
jgi:hypothetical protein